MNEATAKKWKSAGKSLAAIAVLVLVWMAGGIHGIDVGKREAQQGQAEVLHATSVGETALDANRIEQDLFLKHQGFAVSQDLVWRKAGDGLLIADTTGGGVCLQLDRNGADGLFCSGAVSEDPNAPKPDGAVIYNWLQKAKGESVADAQPKAESRADKYRAVQREMRQSLEALERASR